MSWTAPPAARSARDGAPRSSTSATRCWAPSHPIGTSPAAFYIPSMPDALLARHGIESDEVRGINKAFAAGDVERALALTPDELADRIVVAGTPEDWVEWLTTTYRPCGLGHALVSFADPYSLDAWAGVRLEGVPSLVEQVRLFGEQVLPRV